VAAFLGKIGGREIDADALRRQRQPQRAQGRPHPFAALADRLVGQADDREGEIAGRHQHLHIDAQDLGPLEGHRAHLCLHQVLLLENNHRTVWTEVNRA
jgi:hypothetical protein